MKRNRRQPIERPATGTETWRRQTVSGAFIHHTGLRRGPGRGRRHPGDTARQITVVEPWGCFSTRYP